MCQNWHLPCVLYMFQCSTAVDQSIQDSEADVIRERYLYFSSATKNKHILDVRCGAGCGAAALRDCASYTGVNPSPDAIEDAKAHLNGAYCRAEMIRLPFECGSFDVVLCLGLENIFLSDLSAFLAEAWRVLRPGGSLVVTAPMLHQLKHSGNPSHFFEYTPEIFRLLVERYFGASSIEQFAGPEGPELRFVGERLATPASANDDAIRDALCELGYAAVTPALSTAEAPLSIAVPANVSGWLEELPWDCPLQAADRISALLQHVIRQAEIGHDRSIAEQCHDVLDWLDERQDAKTGLWGAGSLSERLAACGRFAPYYDYFYRPMRGLTRMADAALSLDHRSPMEAAAAWRLHLLCAIRGKTRYRAEDIKVALTRAFWILWNETVASAEERQDAPVLRHRVLANISSVLSADLPAIRSHSLRAPESGHCRCEYDASAARLWMREPSGGSA